MRDCALTFLGSRMCWLQDEDALREKEEAGAVEKRVCGEEYEVIQKDAGPDGGDEENYTDLGDHSSA